ncbi:MAG: PEP-CTERM sorting domain-containing protein [Myxococcota bacterium]
MSNRIGSGRTGSRGSDRRGRGGAVAFACGVALTLASAGQAQQVVSVSPDVTIQLGAANLTTADQNVAVDNQLGVVALQNLGAIPDNADVTGYADAGNGLQLFSVDTTVALPGGVTATPSDVVSWNGATHALLFDGSAVGIPSGVQVDAIGFSNGLVLSFDTDVSLPGGITAADEDLVKLIGSTWTLVFDGSANGIDRALDVDGAQADPGGAYLVSFDTAGTVGAITFQDEDILRNASGVWSMVYDASAADGDWGAADLDALQVPEPGAIAMLFSGALALAGLGRRRR